MIISSSESTRLEYQHKSLIELINDLSDEQIRRQIIAGKWPIFENIVHLAVYQHTFIARVKQMLQENNPSFPRYTAETDPLFHDYCAKTTHEVIKDLFGIRKDMISLFLLLKKEELARTGEHPVYGKFTLLQWLNFFLLHEAHHLFTIFKLAAELRKS